MKHMRKRIALLLAVVVFSLIIQPFCGSTIRAEEGDVYCTQYEVCKDRQVGDLYFRNIIVYYDTSSAHTRIFCDVTNLSDKKIAPDKDFVTMYFYKDGKEIIGVMGFFGSMSPGETRMINSAVADMDLTDADFMAIGYLGRPVGDEMASIDGEEFKRSRFVENVLVLDNFELCKVRQGCWRFRGKATAIKDMYVHYEITFTFTGEDNRTEQCSRRIKLDKNGSIWYSCDFGDMSWVKDMEVSFEKDEPGMIILDAEGVEGAVPGKGVKFTGFEITGDGGEKFWRVTPFYDYEDADFQIIEAYYEFLDKKDEILMTYTQEVFNKYDTVPELDFETDMHMERAVRARAYFRTRLFYESEKTPQTEATKPPEEKPKPDKSPEPTRPPSGTAELIPEPFVSFPPSSPPVISEKEELAGAISLKTGKTATGLPVLSLKGREVSGKYQIYRSAKKGSGYKKIAETLSNKYIDKTVKDGKIYYYKARQVIRADGKINPGPFTKCIRAAVPGQNIPQFQIQSKTYSAKLNYAEIRLKKYQGDHIQIFYRKPGEEFKNIKLKRNRISKQKKIFRISYEKKISGLYIKIRTYTIQNGRKQYSDFSKSIKVKRNGKISVNKDGTS